MTPVASQPQRRRRPRGFSFAEVMFAVIILGIGFIMVAAIFPVAIQQNQATVEQATSAAFARASANVIQQLRGYNAGVGGYYVGPSQPVSTAAAAYPTYVFPFDSNTPAAGVPFQHGSYFAVAGSLISAADPRFAVVPLYSLSQNSKYAQLYLFNLAVRNQPTYVSADVEPTTPLVAASPPTFLPKLLLATITAGTPSLITFPNNTMAASWTGVAANVQPAYTSGAFNAVGTGCYVLVGSDNGSYAATPAVAAGTAGLFNGKVYKVGNQRLDVNPNGTVWELVPGSDFVTQVASTSATPPAPTTITGLTKADVWIVGKGPDAPGSTVFTGGVQDVSFYTTYVPLQ